MKFYGTPLLWLFSICLPAQAQTDIDAQLKEIDRLLSEARMHSEFAEVAPDIAGIKQHSDKVFEMVWGQPSGLIGGSGGAAAMHGWKTRWQTTGEEYDEDHVARHGNQPPQITDVMQLGIMGRARYLRGLLREAAEADQSHQHLSHVIHSLNNVIGWMRLDDGVTKAENQPRVDLTYVWDAPAEFWNSSADTGWLHEAFAQALNILKTDYQGDVKMARAHATDMTAILDRCRNGVDANGDGSVAPAMMEGGLETALTHAGYAGLLR